MRLYEDERCEKRGGGYFTIRLATHIVQELVLVLVEVVSRCQVSLSTWRLRLPTDDCAALIGSHSL